MVAKSHHLARRLQRTRAIDKLSCPCGGVATALYRQCGRPGLWHDGLLFLPCSGRAGRKRASRESSLPRPPVRLCHQPRSGRGFYQVAGLAAHLSSTPAPRYGRRGQGISARPPLSCPSSTVISAELGCWAENALHPPPHERRLASWGCPSCSPMRMVYIPGGPALPYSKCAPFLSTSIQEKSLVSGLLARSPRPEEQSSHPRPRLPPLKPRAAPVAHHGCYRHGRRHLQ